MRRPVALFTTADSAKHAKSLARQRTRVAAGFSYRVGQRVFGRHGASQEYFHGYVVAIHVGDPFPYSVDVGADEPIRVVEQEIESDLPEPGATWDELVEWLDPRD